ncbi:MAG: hypothetical protein J6V21_05130 [Alistipes sp.]|nr:hypothetical protein [Alistipes sp.]
MKKFLLIYAMGATLLLIACVAILRHSHSEVLRLRNNNEALASETKLYKTRYDDSAASVVAMQLQLKEYKEQHARDAKQIRALGLQLRRVESVTRLATESRVEFVAPKTDTTTLCDTLSQFRWSDDWVAVEGKIQGERVECSVRSVDTLCQIIHRVPRRFLFIRYGIKAIRQEIISSNPHSHIVYAEYIELPKRQRRR